MAVTLASVDGTWANSPSYDAGELRRADAAMFASAGVATGLAVSVDGADVVTVTPGKVVISGEDAAAGTGVYRAGTAVAATGNLEARNATNPRIDLVVFRQYDTDVVGAHPRQKTEIEIITGTASATPGVPTKPSMAVELARITVPASGGGAASVNSTFRTLAVAVGAGPVGAPPFAMAAGTTLLSGSSVTTGGFASVSVTFPAGRFTVPPLVIPHVIGWVTGSSLVVARQVGSVTTNGCTLSFVNTGGVASWASLPVGWRAVQMTPTAAAG